MRNNTQAIYDCLSKGQFLSVDSSDNRLKHLYNDIEDNFEDYADYFRELGFRLEVGEGYYYFSRIDESKARIEDKLESFCRWIDYLDFLKTYNSIFSVGYQFRKASIVEQANLDVDLKDKARRLSTKQTPVAETIDKIVDEMEKMGFVELINDFDGTYKVISAFHYAEELVNLLTISNEDEIPQ